jgi:hypothetical protein
MVSLHSRDLQRASRRPTCTARFNARRDALLAGTLDIAPTILNRANVQPYNGIQGLSLLPVLDNANATARLARLDARVVLRSNSSWCQATESLGRFAFTRYGCFSLPLSQNRPFMILPKRDALMVLGLGPTM